MVNSPANQLLIKFEQADQPQLYKTQQEPLSITNNINAAVDSKQDEKLELVQETQQRILQQHEIPHMLKHAETKMEHMQQLILESPLAGIYTVSSKSAASYSESGLSLKYNPENSQFKCSQCSMTFGSKSAHSSHIKSHTKTVLLGSSPFLGCETITENDLNDPQGIPKSPTIRPLSNIAPGADPYECNVCFKTFAVPARLIRHYRTHTGERPFECEFCHKLFSVKENLQVHRRIHTKERPYKCDVCGRAFEHSGKLHRHMRIHTGERPHKCSVCEKTFIQSGQLVIHMRTHTGEKPYKCQVESCGKGFTCSKQLKVHSRTHTGEKPYHCDICFRDFGYNHVLKLHRVQHYGAKCYKCTICDETFKNKKDMEAHIKGHASELPDGGSDAHSITIDETESLIKKDTSKCKNTIITTKGRPKSRQLRGLKFKNCELDSQSYDLNTKSNSMIFRTPKSCPEKNSTIPLPSEIQPRCLSFQPEHHFHASGNLRKQNEFAFPDEDLPKDLKMEQTPQQIIYNQMQATGEYTSSSKVELPLQAEILTINPALLEAANIARRDNDDVDVQIAALQMMQLRKGDKPHSPILQSEQSIREFEVNFDDSHESNVLIEHFKCGELKFQGLHKGYAPVPKFESSLPNHDIVRRVEAAIGLRSSTDSLERSSSPESDSLMMADRNVLTLPLRKRKHYINDSESGNSTSTIKNSETPSVRASAINSTNTSKVTRISSVIQFAKAS